MKQTFKIGLIMAVALAINCALTANLSASTAGFLTGADMSDLSYFESNGIIYKDNGQVGDALQILKNHGINCIRLRLWTSSAAQASANPWDYINNLDYTVPLARRVKSAGLLFMLDFHYSDTWADPAHQAIPSAWTNLDFTQLVQEMRTYNSNCMAAFQAAGAMPDYVQVGNEISSGMLWPVGQVPGTNATVQWSQLGQLMSAAVRGIRDAAGTNMPKIVIHLPWGADWNDTEWFFDNLQQQNVPFDIIGESYYEWWDGPWQNVPTCLTNAALRYAKPVIIAETDFPFMNSTDVNGIPATPDGQVQYTGTLGQIVTNVPNRLGAGIFWWGTEYESPNASYAGYGERSFFDTNGNVLPVASAFGALATTTSTSTNPPVAPTIFTVTANYGQVSLTWSAVANATSYNVKRATSSGAETTIATTASTDYTDTSVVGGRVYYYMVSAVNYSGEGPDSAEVTAMPLSPAVLYQEDWGTTNGGSKVTLPTDVGWNQVLSSDFCSGFFQYTNRDDETGAGLPANSMWFGDSDAGPNLALFCTTNGAGSGIYGDSAFTSIDPALFANLEFSVYAQWGWNGGALQSWFAVQVEGAWYVSTNHPIVPNQAGGDHYHRTDMAYSPAATNWNELTVGPTVVIGGSVATDLSGPITGIGLVVESTGGWWNINELQVALVATAPTTLGGITAGVSSGNSVALNWTASANVHLQNATSLAPPVVWTDVPNTTGQGSATITTTNIQMFLRQIQP